MKQKHVGIWSFLPISTHIQTSWSVSHKWLVHCQVCFNGWIWRRAPTRPSSWWRNCWKILWRRWSVRQLKKKSKKAFVVKMECMYMKYKVQLDSVYNIESAFNEILNYRGIRRWSWCFWRRLPWRRWPRAKWLDSRGGEETRRRPDDGQFLKNNANRGKFEVRGFLKEWKWGSEPQIVLRYTCSSNASGIFPRPAVDDCVRNDLLK